MSPRRPAAPALLATLLAVLALGACESDEEEVDLDTRLDTIAGEVAEVRELDVDTDVDAEVLDPEAFSARVLELGQARTGQVASAEQEAAEAVLVALGHLEEGVDLDALSAEAVEGGVVGGVYVPEEEAIYLPGRDEGLDALGEVTAAHEVTHALQDRTVGLDSLLDLAVGGDPDAFLAFNAVVEGDAVWTQERWSRAHQDPEERAAYLSGGDAEALAEGQQALEALPPYLRDQLLFPYTAGADFVEALVAEGGVGAIDEALADPPTTTAEILEPERYLDGFEPVDVAVETSPGADWEEGISQGFGAFDLQMLLVRGDVTALAPAARSWSGGPLASWTREGQHALAARVTFTDDGAAERVCEALPGAYRAGVGGADAGDDGPDDGDDATSNGDDGPDASDDATSDGDDAVVETADGAFAVACGPAEVRFAVAPDAALATALVEGN
ncbi:MAG: hypothetical protein R6T85_07695 [Egibacteraceae bacterium]